jgi:hypothetical protein
MYIDDKVDLPWNTKRRFDSRYGNKSISVLIPQDIKILNRTIFAQCRLINFYFNVSTFTKTTTSHGA